MPGVSVAFITFLSAMCVALTLTPRVASWASHKGICDYPSSRRVHLNCIPRAGGIALFVSFFISYLIALTVTSEQESTPLLQREQIFFFLVPAVFLLLGCGMILKAYLHGLNSPDR